MKKTLQLLLVTIAVLGLAAAVFVLQRRRRHTLKNPLSSRTAQPISIPALSDICAGVPPVPPAIESVRLVDVATICPLKTRDGFLSSKADLCRYLVTPQYAGKDWNSIVRSVSTPLQRALLESKKVLLLEEGAKRYIDSDLTCVGIVVRRGAQLLFLDEKNIVVKCEFCLCESGGLLQAGTEDAGYRNKLKFTFSSPSSNYGPVHSEYAGSVYAPGAQGGHDFAGHSLHAMSVFDYKVFAIGFNGTVCLCSALPEGARYQGTWGVEGDVVINRDDLLSVYDDDSTSLENNTEVVYPCVWARLEDAMYKRRTTKTIYIDRRDTLRKDGSLIDLGWKRHDKIVVTARSKISYLDPSTDKTQTGMLPLWMDHLDGSKDAEANSRANSEILGEEADTGVEVCTVADVRLSGGRWAIDLSRPLHFDHDSRRQKYVSDTIGGARKSIIVDTQLHVCLLTRNIVIAADLQPVTKGEPDHTSCNAWHYKSPNAKYGTVTCNYDGKDGGGTMFERCYKDITDPAHTPFFPKCGSSTPQQVSTGHWLHGTTDLRGCDAIWGGQLLAKLGANVVLSGVEFDRFGTPGNFGSIARYPIHFHLCGFARSFNEYSRLQRQLTVNSCSIWRSFSRWVVVHGTHEANIKNNVGFISFGSPFFVEDGCEIANTFEHNIGICALPASYNAYWNPIPIYPNVSSDLCQMAVFWLKNSRNRLLRNVGCCSPNPVIGVWMVPQPIRGLEGPSTLPAGDPGTEIPVIGAQQNCYAPERFEGTYTDSSGCSPFFGANSANPYGYICENVFYTLAAGLSEFPEFIHNGVPNADGTLTGGPNPLACNAAAVGFTTPDEEGKYKTEIPQFMPMNGQNACTDRAVTTYIEPTWLKGVRNYVSGDVLNDPKSQSFDVKAEAVPKIIVGMLTYNLGPNGGNLWGGAGWTKNGISFIVNSCFLDFLGGTGLPQGPVVKGRQGHATYPSSTAGVWSYTTGGVEGSPGYGNSFHVFYNNIVAGNYGLPANPTIMGGPKAFVSNKTVGGILEYDRVPQGVNVYYFLDNVFQNIFPPSFFTQGFQDGGVDAAPSHITLRLVNVDDDAIYDYYSPPGSLPRRVEGARPSNWTQRTRKYPYICGDDKNNWGLLPLRSAYGTHAEALVSGSFTTERGIALANRLCDLLSRIPNYVCPAYAEGDKDKNIAPARAQAPLKGTLSVPCKVDYT